MGPNTQHILEYGQAEGNWSPDLTALHEQEAGSDHPIDVLSRKTAARTLRRHLRDEKSLVLDVGSSSGYLVEEIRRSLPEAQLICSDFLTATLRRLAQSHPDIPLLQFDVCQCPLPSDSLDAVTALNVLEHIRDDAGALQQIARVLKKGGLAYLEVPAHPWLYGPYDKQLLHHRRYRMSDLLALARQAGFDVLQTNYLGFTIFAPYAVVKLADRMRSMPADAQQKAVAAEIRSTRKNRLVQALLNFEFRLGRYLRYPTGIRCVVTLAKR